MYVNKTLLMFYR